eukprot:CAMPEP_0184671658 /NCGR_PEP_ID=MMETSP0308-20130426/85630_1 /TAXON_ID=38269 /ORGANISM="Gloeochaete witrockiana, Strain SAG 46.84" /LENGTH=634 /DNA_ID=CAMNT_0027118829 /DNA_START=168 /DNA_END=2073 /DNA_ORIENTATION=+
MENDQSLEILFFFRRAKISPVTDATCVFERAHPMPAQQHSHDDISKEFYQWRTSRVSEMIGYRFIREMASNPNLDPQQVLNGINRAIENRAEPMSEDEFQRAMFSMEQKAFLDMCAHEGLDPKTEILKGYLKAAKKYIEDGKFNTAIELMDSMTGSWGVHPDAHVYNSILEWLLESSNPLRAVLLFRKMLRFSLVNDHTYDILLRTCGQFEHELPARFSEILTIAKGSGIPPKVNVYWAPSSLRRSSSSNCVEVIVQVEHCLDSSMPPRPLLAPPSHLLSPSPDYSDSAVELQSPNGARVFLFGFDSSSDSVQKLAALVRKVKPDSIMVELCKDRTALLTTTDSANHPIVTMTTFGAIPFLNQTFRFIWRAMGLFDQQATREALDTMMPGLEYRVAAQLAEEVGAELFLGDRSWRETVFSAVKHLQDKGELRKVLWHTMKAMFLCGKGKTKPRSRPSSSSSTTPSSRPPRHPIGGGVVSWLKDFVFPLNPNGPGGLPMQGEAHFMDLEQCPDVLVPFQPSRGMANDESVVVGKEEDEDKEQKKDKKSNNYVCADSLVRDFEALKEYPSVMRAFIAERDEYMVSSIGSLAGPTVVAVVGSVHVPGIVKGWGKFLNSQSQSLTLRPFSWIHLYEGR